MSTINKQNIRNNIANKAKDLNSMVDIALDRDTALCLRKADEDLPDYMRG